MLTPDVALLADPFAWPAPWQWVVGVWVFAVGASVGSFLNVVIYRVPAGSSIVYPPSHCPACKHAIRWYDNIPVISWLLLRGRCRDCRARISPRYAAVELGSGLLLLALATTGPLGVHGNLDAMLGDAAALVAWGQVAYLEVLLAGLWAAALIALDGHRPPAKLLLALLVVGFAGALAFPSLHTLSIAATFGTFGTTTMPSVWVGPIGAGVGAAAAWLVCMTGIGRRAANDSRAMLTPSRSVVVGWGAAAGLFLGWQLALAAAMLAALTLLLAVAVHSLRPHRNDRPIESIWLVCYAAAASAAAVLREGPRRAMQIGFVQETFDLWRWWPLAAILVIALGGWSTGFAHRRFRCG